MCESSVVVRVHKRAVYVCSECMCECMCECVCECMCECMCAVSVCESTHVCKLPPLYNQNQ